MFSFNSLNGAINTYTLETKGLSIYRFNSLNGAINTSKK